MYSISFLSSALNACSKGSTRGSKVMIAVAARRMRSRGVAAAFALPLFATPSLNERESSARSSYSNRSRRRRTRRVWKVLKLESQSSKISGRQRRLNAACGAPRNPVTSCEIRADHFRECSNMASRCIFLSHELLSLSGEAQTLANSFQGSLCC